MKRLNAPRPRSTQTGASRRHFLAVLGATGLSTSVAVFGSATPAVAAGSCSCCSLKYCPPNTSISSCQSVKNYTWSCRVCSGGTCVTCVCCEKISSGGGYYASALDCRLT